MSWKRRLGKVVSGLYGGLEAIPGLVKDIATAPFDDEDEYDGIVDELYNHTKQRGVQFLGNLIGPEEGLGAVIGGLPEAIRAPARKTVQPIGEKLEWGYREIIAEPIATYITVGSLVDSPSHRFGEFEVRTWRRAHQIIEREKRSPGQALALLHATDTGRVKDILDPVDVARYTGTTSYEHWSGITDVFLNLFASPEVFAGYATKVVRAPRIIRNFEDIERVTKTKNFSRFLNDTAGKNSAQIRNQFFANNSHGALISTIIADAHARGGATLAERSTRAMLGDWEEIGRLSDEFPDIGNMIHRTYQEIADAKVPAPVGAGGQMTLPLELPSARPIEQLRKELDVLYDLSDRQARTQATFGLMREVPRVRRTDDLRARITHTEIYQKNFLGSPLRKVFNQRPHPIINLHDPSSDIQIERFLRKSDLPIAQRQRFVSNWHKAIAEGDKIELHHQAEAAAVESIIRTALEKHGGRKWDDLDPPEKKVVRGHIQLIMNESRLGRQRSVDALRSRAYDGKDRSLITLTPEEHGVDMPTEIHYPLHPTQLENALPLVDLDRVRRAADDYARQIGRFSQVRQLANVGMDEIAHLLDGFNSLWKPAVLLRPAWPMRVVGEEQFRIIAILGALSHGRELAAAARWNIKERFPSHLMDADEQKLYENIGTWENDILRTIPKEHRGKRPFNYRGYHFEAARGAPGDLDNVTAHLTSARSAMAAIRGQYDSYLADLRAMATGDDVTITTPKGRKLKGRRTGEVRSINPTTDDAATYAEAWTRDVNFQIRQSPLGRQLLQGKSIDEVTNWLTSTVEGQRVGRRLKHRMQNPRGWVEDAADQINRYLPTERLRERAAKGQVKIEQLIEDVPDAAARPIVHGEVLAQALGTSRVVQFMQDAIDKGMEVFGQKPTDMMSRNRYFESVYRNEVRRLVDLAASQRVRLDDVMQKQIADQARTFALGETKRLLYDLAEQSELAHTLRHVAPFFNAWQEVLTRWVGIAYENPTFVARARMALNSPEAAGLVRDENGNEIDSNGDAWTLDPVTGERVSKVAAGENRYILWSFPEWARKRIPGAKPIGGVMLNKESFNMVLQGAPGMGPIVQIPVNEIVKEAPSLQDSVKFILPFGTTQESLLTQLLPATARRAFTRFSDEENRTKANTIMRIYFDMVVDHELGNRPSKPTMKEAQEFANAFMNLRIFASWVSPAAPTFISPYQPYIDAYRRLKEQDPQNADDKFLEQYGLDYRALTISVSKSRDGVPSTVQGFAARKRNQALIEKYPDFGGLIVGSDGAGEFSRGVYDHQFANRVSPETSQRQREVLSFEEAKVAPDVRNGWMIFRQVMMAIDAEREARGLPNLRVVEAEDLAIIRRAAITAIGKRYEAWAEDYFDVDKLKWDKKIKAFREIVADKNVGQRKEMQGLAAYLKLRDAMVRELDQRKAAGEPGTLRANANEDLQELWDLSLERLFHNLPFQSLYYRYLENDPVTALRFEDEEEAVVGSTTSVP